MVFDDSLKNHECHCADISTVVGDKFKVEVFVFLWDNLRNDGLNLIKLDLGIDASQLFRGCESNDECLKRSDQVWPRDKHKHQVVEGRSQK